MDKRDYHNDESLSGAPQSPGRDGSALNDGVDWDWWEEQFEPKDEWMVAVAWVCALGFCIVCFYLFASLVEWLV